MLKNTEKFQKYYDPWEHIVSDNFYNSTLFERMRLELSAIFNKVMDSQQVCYINDISKFENTLACVSSNKISDKYLTLFSKHRPFTKLTTRNQIIFCKGKLDYRIHDESEKKILSAVTYITPDTAIGTHIYNADKSFNKSIEWLPNRLLMFCGETNKTWHSYHCDSSQYRITLNTFLEIDS